MTWNQLQERSILNTANLKKLYKLCSNHAHSEYISAIQINELSPLSKNPELIGGVKLGISSTSIILSAVNILLKNKFKCAEIIFNALPAQQYEDIYQWFSLGVKKDQ